MISTAHYLGQIADFEREKVQRLVDHVSEC